jgi:hypothetical protein
MAKGVSVPYVIEYSYSFCSSSVIYVPQAIQQSSVFSMTLGDVRRCFLCACRLAQLMAPFPSPLPSPNVECIAPALIESPPTWILYSFPSYRTRECPRTPIGSTIRKLQGQVSKHLVRGMLAVPKGLAPSAASLSSLWLRPSQLYFSRYAVSI